MCTERAFLRLINNTIIRIDAKRTKEPIILPIITILVGCFVLEVLLVVPEDGV